MIQRIQSLYLLLATLLVGILFFAPAMWFSYQNAMVELHAFELSIDGAHILSTPVYFPILLGAATLLPLITIFCFKNRMLQIRLCGVEAVLLIGLAAMEALLFWGDVFTIARGALTPASFTPIAALLFVWLAARATLRDELLVRSLDRIR